MSNAVNFNNMPVNYGLLYAFDCNTYVDGAETWDKYVVPNFIRCGAIPKDRLVKGKTYFGGCRNSSTATWNGNEFEYERYKFGSSFNETINHFEDDDGYDLFVPIREINSE